MSPVHDDALVRLESIEFSYGSRKALDGVDFTLCRGDRIAVVGGNGAGKSTLLKILAGIVEPQSGRVTAGTACRGLRAAYLPDGPYMEEWMSVRAWWLYAGWLSGLGRAEIFSALRGLREPLGLDGLEKRLIGTLSHGERKRVAMAACLMVRPQLLLLDEPGDGLDPGQRRLLAEVLRERWRGTLVLTTHWFEEASALCDEAVLMSEGRIVERGEVDALWRRCSMETASGRLQEPA